MEADPLDTGKPLPETLRQRPLALSPGFDPHALDYRYTRTQPSDPRTVESTGFEAIWADGGLLQRLRTAAGSTLDEGR